MYAWSMACVRYVCGMCLVCVRALCVADGEKLEGEQERFHREKGAG